MTDRPKPCTDLLSGFSEAIAYKVATAAAKAPAAAAKAPKRILRPAAAPAAAAKAPKLALEDVVAPAVKDPVAAAVAVREVASLVAKVHDRLSQINMYAWYDRGDFDFKEPLNNYAFYYRK